MKSTICTKIKCGIINFKLILVPLIAILFSCNYGQRKLPFYGNKQAVEKIVNGTKIVDTVYATIPPFNFLNQDSVRIDNHLFDGKIYVADFFFTSCPTICPTIHRNLLSVYRKFLGNKQVMYLSHSIDYRYDVPHVLKAYANKLGVHGDQWQFIHGSRDSVYSLAEKNYLVAVEDDAKDPGAYVHQGYLVLIDKHKRVRGAYDGTNTEQVDQLSKDMDLLLKEK